MSTETILYSQRCEGRVKELLKKIETTFHRNGSSRKIETLETLYWSGEESSAFISAVNNNIRHFDALYVAVSRRFNVCHELASVTQSVDTLTDKNCRGRGHFIRLADATYEMMGDRDVKFVYGFPNDKSYGTFVNKLNWVGFGPVPLMISIRRPVNLALKRVGINLNFFSGNNAIPDFFKAKDGSSFVLKRISHFNSDFDGLWKSFSASIAASVTRDSSYLNWRYFSTNGESYHVYAIYFFDKIVGYIILSIKDKHNARICYIMDLVCIHQANQVIPTLSNFLDLVYRREGVDVSLVWCFNHSPNYHLIRSLRFVSFPVWLRPIQVFMGFRPLALDSATLEILKKKESWYISFADSDTN